MNDPKEQHDDGNVGQTPGCKPTAVAVSGSNYENDSAAGNAKEYLSGSDDSDARCEEDGSERKCTDEPQPTYVPAALAMGIMMLLWGILTNWIMSAAGALVMVWAVTAWIREMHEP